MEKAHDDKRKGLKPTWISINENGEDYCDLCWKVATKEHLASDKHRRQEWYENERQTHQSGQMPKPGELPPGYGNAAWYTWNSEQGKYLCNLCWRFMEPGHIRSNRHTTRAADPDNYFVPQNHKYLAIPDIESIEPSTVNGSSSSEIGSSAVKSLPWIPPSDDDDRYCSSWNAEWTNKVTPWIEEAGDSTEQASEEQQKGLMHSRSNDVEDKDNESDEHRANTDRFFWV